MFPRLDGIDHVLVYVTDSKIAVLWYEKNLGFKVSESFKFWAEDEGGPLTIEDPSGKSHLALSQKDKIIASAAIAFKTSALPA